MTHGVLEECDIKRLQRHCYKVHDRNAPVEKLEDFINNINSVLESLYIEIKKGVTEDDGRPIYALVNLATTSVSKMASDFAENELDLFRKALELIIDSESGFASSTNILNLVDQLKGKKMRKKEAEQVLQKFVQNKWLIEKEGEFTLHGRAILEMEQYIREVYPDAVKVCNICHGLLIQVPRAPSRSLFLGPGLRHCCRLLRRGQRWASPAWFLSPRLRAFEVLLQKGALRSFVRPVLSWPLGGEHLFVSAVVFPASLYTANFVGLRSSAAGPVLGVCISFFVTSSLWQLSPALG
uniref:Non-structural maintenance of chromosomes element 1 homolog n=1 Tax=Sus scrofa TaxID=9823 RepID=A0A8D0TP27_PIG